MKERWSPDEGLDRAAFRQLINQRLPAHLDGDILLWEEVILQLKQDSLSGGSCSGQGVKRRIFLMMSFGIFSQKLIDSHLPNE